MHGFRGALADGKLEIRTIASTGLSGLVKVLPDASVATLRDELLTEAAAVFPAQQQRALRKNGVKAEAASKRNGVVAEEADLATRRHACLLGLRALLQSSPHTIPNWCATLAKRAMHQV